MTLIRISGPAAALQFTVLGPELYDAVPPSHAGGASRIGPSDADGPQAEGSTSSDSDRGILTPDSSDTGSVVDSALSLLANLDPSSSSDSDPSLDSADSSINGRRYIRHAVRLLSVDDDSNGAAVHPQGVWPEWDLSSDEGQITACRDVFLYALSDVSQIPLWLEPSFHICAIQSHHHFVSDLSQWFPTRPLWLETTVILCWA